MVGPGDTASIVLHDHATSALEERSLWKVALATVALTWYLFILLVSTVGYLQLCVWMTTQLVGKRG